MNNKIDYEKYRQVVEYYLYFKTDICNKNPNKEAHKIGTTTDLEKRKNQHESTGVERLDFIEPINVSKINNKIINQAKDPDTALINELWKDPDIRDNFYWNGNRKDKETIDAANKDGISLNHNETLWPKDNISNEMAKNLLIEKIKKILNYDDDIYRKEPLTFVEFQQKIYQKALDSLLNLINVLLDCCPRDGKSLIFIRLMKELNVKFPLIISWWISPDSFEKELKYRGYEKYSFVMYNSKRFKEIMRTGIWNENEIIYISAQTFQKLSVNELNVIKNHCDFLGIDEIHNGTDTKKFNIAYEKAGLDDVRQVHMSGTPYDDLLCGRYSDLKWTHIRHSTLDRLHDKLIAKDDDYFTKNFPDINMFLVESMHKIAEKLYKEFNEYDEFSWEKYFDKASDRSIKTYLRALMFGDIKNSKYEGWDYNTFSNICERFNIKNWIWSLDKINIVNRLYKIIKELINEDDEFKNVTVTALTGKGINEAKHKNVDPTTYVNDVFRRNKGKINIVLTVDAGMTGKTYEEANGFIFMRNIKSSERIDQYYNRGLTPFENKKNAVIIFADSQQMTSAVGQLIDDGIYSSSETDHNIMKEKLKKINENGCLNIFKEGNLKFNKLSYQDIIKIHAEYALSSPLINFNGLYQKIIKSKIDIMGYLSNYDEFKSLKIKISNKFEKQIGEDERTSGRKSSTTIFNKNKNDENKNNDFTINQKVLFTICQNIQLIRALMIKNYGLEDEGCIKILNGEFPSKDWWKKRKVQFTSNEENVIPGERFFEIVDQIFTIKEIEMQFKRFAYIDDNNQFNY